MKTIRLPSHMLPSAMGLVAGAMILCLLWVVGTSIRAGVFMDESVEARHDAWSQAMANARTTNELSRQAFLASRVETCLAALRVPAQPFLHLTTRAAIDHDVRQAESRCLLVLRGELLAAASRADRRTIVLIDQALRR